MQIVKHNLSIVKKRYSIYMMLYLVISVFISVVWFSSSVLSQSVSGLSQKIGMVNNQKILVSVPEAILARKELEKEIKAKQDELMAQKTEIEKLNKEFIDKSALLTAEARDQRRSVLEQKVMEIRQKEFTFQQEIREKEAVVTQKIVAKIAEKVKIIAKAKKLGIVFESTQAGIMYLDDYVDITDDVIVAFSSEQSTNSQTQPSSSKNSQKKSK